MSNHGTRARGDDGDDDVIEQGAKVVDDAAKPARKQRTLAERIEAAKAGTRNRLAAKRKQRDAKLAEAKVLDEEIVKLEKELEREGA